MTTTKSKRTTKEQITQEEITEIGRLQGLQTFCIIANGRHPTYMLEKSEFLHDPVAFQNLDDSNKSLLDQYFIRWEISDLWDKYQDQIKSDYWNISSPDFKKKYNLTGELKC